MSEITKLDCPFCAGSNLIQWAEGGTLGSYRFILCADCHARGPATRFMPGELVETADTRAAELWNDQWALQYVPKIIDPHEL